MVDSPPAAVRTAMTPRQRIVATLKHQTPDRVPTDGWFHPEVKAELLKHFQTPCWDDVLTALGIVGWAEVDIPIVVPAFEAKATPRPGGRPGPVAIWHDTQVYEDAWGVRRQLGDDDRYEQWLGGPLEGIEDPAALPNHIIPTPEALCRDSHLAQRVGTLKQAEQFVVGHLPNPFKMAWQLRGMVDFLTDYAANPAMVHALYDRLYALYDAMAAAYVEAGVDMISITGDIGMQNGLMINPKSWRHFDQPRLRGMIQACRAIKPDVFFYFHSDGNIMDVMDDLIATGFDVINPIQPECMDPREVKRRWGDRITLYGGVSIQKTLPFGSVQDVKDEVQNLIHDCGRDGGLVVFPSNVIQPDTPVENIIACFHAARDCVLWG